MIFSADLCVEAGTIIKPDWEGEYFVSTVEFELDDGDSNQYGTRPWLTNGILIGVYDRETDEPLECSFEERELNGNVHFQQLGLGWDISVLVPETAYFGVKVRDNLSGLENHAIHIERSD